MAGKLRQLGPHFLAMLLLYAISVAVVAVLFDIRQFWTSLAIALLIAVVYPRLTRYLGIAPESWLRESETERGDREQ